MDVAPFRCKSDGSVNKFAKLGTCLKAFGDNFQKGDTDKVEI